MRWGGSQRVGAEEDQAQAGLGKRRLEHGPVPSHGLDRGQDPVGRRPGKFDRATGFHGDPAAARQGGKPVEHRGDFVPAGPAVRGGRVVAMGLEFQTHPSQRGVHQAAVGDVLRDGRGVGELGDFQLRGGVGAGRPRSRRSDRGERHITIPSGPATAEHAPADRFPAQLIERYPALLRLVLHLSDAPDIFPSRADGRTARTDTRSLRY